jgi:N-acyl-phosphatidylethanolamine-hydrolysing phospholipase D
MFSARASAVQFAGPKRYTAPACKVKDLPPLSAVLVSHNHYDHLDLGSVSRLAELQPNISWFVPAGMAKWLKDNTMVSGEKVHEMTWWQEEQLEGTNIKIVFTPANHWGKRSVADDNQMLWGSFAVIGQTKRFWFGGDTGYCEAFKQIGEKYGPFDLAAIPIGNK